MSFQTQLLQYLQRERSPTSISTSLVQSTTGTVNHHQQIRDDNGGMQQNLIAVGWAVKILEW